MVKVAQCWDDGVTNDIRLIELLKKYHAKATFNLNPGLHEEKRQEPLWVPAGYADWSFKGFRCGKVGKAEMLSIYRGFQVASHCWRHENADAHPLPVFVKAATDAKHFLEDLFQQECPGFAWPCGIATPEAADALRDAGFAYGRMVTSTEHVEAYEHPMMLKPSCHVHDGVFYRRFAEAKARNGIFYFWGHSYEMLDSAGLWEQMERKLDFLSSDPEVEWVDVIDLVRPARNSGK